MYLIKQEYLDEYMPKVKGVTYREFTYSDTVNFEGLEDDNGFQITKNDRKRRLVHQSECGPCITALVNNRPVAIFGMVLIWDGVGESWSVFGNQARRYPIAMTKGANAFFDICYQGRSFCVHFFHTSAEQLSSAETGK